MPDAKKIVFVVGAGASVELGYPLGDQLVQRVRQDDCELASSSWGGDGPGRERYAASLKRAQARLGPASPNSIDDFFARCVDDAIVGDLMDLVARSIIRCEVSQACTAIGVASFHRVLFDYVTRNGLDRWDETVRIITFNYDHSIEIGMTKLVWAYSGGEYADAYQRACALRVLRLHGETTAHPSELLQQANEKKLDQSSIEGQALARRLSGRLRLVSSSGSKASRGVYTEDVAAAREWLGSADVIAFLGFGMHEANLKTLGLGVEPEIKLANPWMFSTTVKWTDREARSWSRFEAMGARSQSLGPGNTQGEISCEDVVRQAIAAKV